MRRRGGRPPRARVGPPRAVRGRLVLSLAAAAAVLVLGPTGTDAAGASAGSATALRDAEASAGRFAAWERCVAWRGVSSFGDPDGAAGYRYDDGSGEGWQRDALALDGRGPSRADFAVLVPLTRPGCRPSSAVAPTAQAASSTPRASRRVSSRGLRRAADRVARAGARWDAWETCLGELGVTEFGTPGGDAGFLLRGLGGWAHTAALALDTGDDPDYLLAGVPRRGRTATCAALVRSPTSRIPSGRVRREDPDDAEGAAWDAAEAIAGFDAFDGCAFAVELRPVGDGPDTGLWFGRRGRRPGLALVAEAPDPAAFAALAVPGEEPPGTECEEDDGPADEQDDD